MKRSKRYNESAVKIDRGTLYPLDDAIQLLQQTSTAKFDESV